jgi:hypothetical protein
VVAADFNGIGIAIDESKAESPLIVDGNCVLSLAVILERMEAIPGRHFQRAFNALGAVFEKRGGTN